MANRHEQQQADLDDARIAREDLQKELQDHQKEFDQLQRIWEEEKSRYRSDIEEKGMVPILLTLVVKSLAEHQRATRAAVNQIAAKLGCHRPASYGDGGSEALGVVVGELLDEFGNIENLKQIEFKEKATDLERQLVETRSQLTSLRNLLSAKDEEIAGCAKRTAAVENELLNKTAHIQKLEKRVSEMQIESGVSSAKLADMQSLRVIATMVKEVAFEGQPMASMDYEDMKNVLQACFCHTWVIL